VKGARGIFLGICQVPNLQTLLRKDITNPKTVAPTETLRSKPLYPQTLYHANQGLSNRGYNYIMSPGRFSQLSKQEWQTFDHDMKVLTGMLYSIVTLKAFFPCKSPAKISDAVGYGLGGTENAPYPMPSQIAGDQEEQNNPL
jgi:hypothetical protein